jgi:hypothetical protein
VISLQLASLESPRYSLRKALASVFGLDKARSCGQPKSECMRLVYSIPPTVAKHLPTVKAYADQIGLVGLINHFVPTEVDAGTVVLGLVLDTLGGRSPLYRLEGS